MSNDGCFVAILKLIGLAVFCIVLVFVFKQRPFMLFKPVPINTLMNDIPFSFVLVDIVKNTMAGLFLFTAVVISVVIAGWVSMLIWAWINFDVERRGTTLGGSWARRPHPDGSCPKCGSILKVHHGGRGADFVLMQSLMAGNIPEQSNVYFTCPNPECKYEYGA